MPHKLFDDAVRDDKEGIYPNLEADRFRQRSSGHGAQGLNTRHLMRAWGSNVKPIIKGKISSRMNLTVLNEGGDMDNRPSQKKTFFGNSK